MFEQEYLAEWKGLPVKKFMSGSTPDDLSQAVYKLGYDWDGNQSMLDDTMNEFFALENVADTKGLIFGMHVDDSADDYYSYVVPRLIAQKDKLPNLQFLSLAEMNYEESELSWIGQGDVGAPLLDAFPGLFELRVRGGMDYEIESAIAFTRCRHVCLEKLVMETVSLRQGAFRGIGESILPELTHLELWLGTEERERTTTPSDVRALLTANPYPKLKYLGLKNCDCINEIAEAIADLPIIGQLDTLDLSLGTLHDQGGNALLNSNQIRSLKKLDLTHNYLSDDLKTRFQALGIEVDLSESGREDTDEGEYYVSVSE